MLRYEDLNKSFINGDWVVGASPQTFEIRNPFDNEVITSVPLATAQQLEASFHAANTAQLTWSKTSPEERKEVLSRASAYLRENQAAVVDLIGRETGGTVLKANLELHLALEVLEESIHMVDELHAIREVPSHMEGKTNYIHRVPIGVISSISPFNFPVNLSMRTIAPALALGNAVVHKPDIQVGLSGGSMIAKAFQEAGLPKGVLNVLLTDISEIGDGMITHSYVNFVSFTGSTPVGRHIGEIAGKHLKRVALELGGNSPFVVLSDADVDRAVDAAIFGKFFHQGQICMAINRFIVHQDVFDEFVQKFASRAKELPCGDPRDPQTVIGPIINEQQMNRALAVIEEAKRSGARVVLEGCRTGNVLTPFIFADVDNASALAQTELFAPIAAVIRAKTDEEAVQLANQTDYGLSASIFTRDLSKGQTLALQIDSGMTHINDQTVNDATTVPVGGTKASGIGRFGNPWIVDEFTTTKWVSLQQTYRDFPL